MKRQLIALLMVIVMVASACAVAATTVSAATPTTFHIMTTTNTPTVGVWFTIRGQLNTSTTLLTNQPVHLESHTKNADGTWAAWGNLPDTYKYTDSSGRVSSTRALTTPGVREYRWHYNGTTTYAAARSVAVTETVKVRTMTTLTVSKTQPVINEKVTFAATVKSLVSTGSTPFWNTLATTTPITVTIYHYNAYLDGRKVRVNDYAGTTTTGKVTWQKSWPTAGTSSKLTRSGTTVVIGSSLRTYYAEFARNNTYTNSTSGGVSINVQKIPTKLTLDSDPSYGATGYFKDQNGNGIGGRTIKVYYKGFSPDSAPPLPYDHSTTTDSTGRYEAGPDSGYYQAKFAGDATYAPSETGVVPSPGVGE